MVDFCAWHLCRQRSAFRLLARLVDWGCWLKLLELQLDGGQIRVDRLIQQVHLIAADLFAAPAELLAPEDRDLVGQLVDTGLPVMQFPFPLVDLPRLLLDLAVPVLDLSHQLRCKIAQLVRAESIQVGGQVHADQSARTLGTVKAQPFTSWLASYPGRSPKFLRVWSLQTPPPCGPI